MADIRPFKLGELESQRDQGLDELSSGGFSGVFFHPSRVSATADRTTAAMRDAIAGTEQFNDDLIAKSQATRAKTRALLSAPSPAPASTQPPVAPPAVAPSAAPAAPQAPVASPQNISPRTDQRPQPLAQTGGALDQIKAVTAAKPPTTQPGPTPPATTQPGAAENGRPDLTDFLNRELLSKGGPTHPATGVFMRGPFRGLTPDQARERLITQHAKQATGGPGLQTGTLSTGGLSGSGKTSDAGWQKLFPTYAGGATPNPTLPGAAPIAAKPAAPAIPGAVTGSTTVGNAQARSIVSPFGYGFASSSPTNRPAAIPNPAGVRPNLYIGDESGNRTREFSQALPQTKGAAGFQSGIGIAPKVDIRPFQTKPTPDEPTA